MEDQSYILDVLERVLGEGVHTSGNNYAFYCPKCKHSKRKLEVNLITTTKNENPWNCWTCGDFRGKTLKPLFSKLNVPGEKYEELNTILGTSYKYNPEELKQDIKVELPKEFQPFINLHKSNITGRHALTYLLRDRKITFEDIIKSNCGFCEYGRYRNKIIIPSYSKEGKVDYFVARAFDDSTHKMDAPICDKNIIGFESLINWNLPVTLCEGAFDALTIKRNAIPLFGKTISPKLREKLMYDRVKSIYLALDEDALKNTFQLAEELLSLGKKLYVVRLNGKDPNEIGFIKYNNLVSNIQLFTYSDLFKLKMELK